ncbi:MAG: hypothetical protein ACJ8AW_08640 [Rhodopila sp.]
MVIGSPVAVMAAVNTAAAKASNRLMVDTALKLQAQPVADMEQAARSVLLGLRPVVEQRWRWQRWTGLIAASAAGAGVAALICVGTWATATVVARRDAGVEVARWQAWWTTTCADQSLHHIVVAGKPVCQVPIERS